MPEKPWFKRKIYGWGWYPASGEGWLTTVIFIVLFGISENTFINNMEFHHSHLDIAVFFTIDIFMITALIHICYKKGEKPRWSWGKSKSNSPEGK